MVDANNRSFTSNTPDQMRSAYRKVYALAIQRAIEARAQRETSKQQDGPQGVMTASGPRRSENEIL